MSIVPIKFPPTSIGDTLVAIPGVLPGHSKSPELLRMLIGNSAVVVAEAIDGWRIISRRMISVRSLPFNPPSRGT